MSEVKPLLSVEKLKHVLSLMKVQLKQLTVLVLSYTLGKF